MSSEFEVDLKELQADLTASRAELLTALESATDADLERGRRGGWTIAEVLGHVIQSEYLYGGVVSAIVGSPAGAPQGDPPKSIEEARKQLTATHDGLLTAVASATEDNFYRIQQFGHDQYSVLSVLENAANHDREHAEQIRRTLAT
jgi:uncharacterized damage-inducible protein DinB